MINPIRPHPEWKQLWHEMNTVLATGQLWGYSELQTIAGIDVRSSRGRAQFLRFAREVEDKLDLHFECERTIGYRVVKANEHGTCSLGRVRRGYRQVKRGEHIASHTRTDELTATEAARLMNVLAHTGRLLSHFAGETKVLRKNEKEIRRGGDLPRLLKPVENK
jgi:hypothetical protein